MLSKYGISRALFHLECACLLDIGLATGACKKSFGCSSFRSRADKIDENLYRLSESFFFWHLFDKIDQK